MCGRGHGRRVRHLFVPAACVAQPRPAAPALCSTLCLDSDMGIVPELQRCDNKPVEVL